MTEISHDCEVGESVPPLTQHAVSVSLPTWDDCVGYEKGDTRVVSRMKTGYPRFFVHKSIQKLGDAILAKYGTSDQSIFLYPSRKVADLFIQFATSRPETEIRPDQLSILEIVPTDASTEQSANANLVSPIIFGCVLPAQHSPLAKQFWQHAGAGISSRRAEYCTALFESGHLVLSSKFDLAAPPSKGPRRYRRQTIGEDGQPMGTKPDGKDQGSFIEERFGRNLNITLALDAKTAIRKRIAAALSSENDSNITKPAEAIIPRVSSRQVLEDDVYLFPSGMYAIFSSHQCLLQTLGARHSVCYGFPYIDTLKILEKFGPGCIFYGHGSQNELVALELRLAQGEKILGLFCEFPSNPLLKSPDLEKIRSLADQYGFAVVVDETVGNFVNVNVLPFADIIVSSLTKIFSGDSNVMGGSAILNPTSPYYQKFKDFWAQEYEDIYWAEDALFMERNSRDFVSRSERIDYNAEAITELLRAHAKVKQVYYPKYSDTRHHYDRCRNEHGGYGGLLSVTFHQPNNAIKFYDYINTFKGPSLGTNFTLSSPYVILAHWTELPWAASYGVESNLVRFSVGLEVTNELVSTFQSALTALE